MVTMNEAQAKAQVRRLLVRRFFFRFHVTLILLWTFAVGLLTTKGLLSLGVASMAVRYPLALVAAYLGFLTAVRVWLWYVECDLRGQRNEGDFTIDFPSGGPGRSRCEPEPRTGGGGASGDYSVDPVLQPELSSGMELGEAASGSAGETVGTVLEGLGAAEEAAIPLALVVLVAAVLGAVLLGGVYVILDAPVVLAEAAFEALLAAGLIRAARRVEEPDWSAAVVRRTCCPSW